MDQLTCLNCGAPLRFSIDTDGDGIDDSHTYNQVRFPYCEKYECTQAMLAAHKAWQGEEATKERERRQAEQEEATAREEAYQAWLETLTPNERALLAKIGSLRRELREEQAAIRRELSLERAARSSGPIRSREGSYRN